MIVLGVLLAIMACIELEAYDMDANANAHSHLRQIEEKDCEPKTLASTDLSKVATVDSDLVNDIRGRRKLFEERQELTLSMIRGHNDSSVVHNHTVSIGVPVGWSLGPAFYVNSRLLVGPLVGDESQAAVKIYMEPRAHHQDALEQIMELVSFGEENKFLEVGGWPAAQIKQSVVLEHRGSGEAEGDKDALLVATYVAFEDLLVQVAAYLAPDADEESIKLIFDIGQSLEFATQEEESTVASEIEQLLSGSTGSRNLREVVKEHAPPPQRRAQSGTSSVGGNERISQVGYGELEIATSPDGLNIVVALQGRRFVQSNDGGATFVNSVTPAQVGFGNGDPSIAWAQNGAFYIAWIDSNCASNYQSFIPNAANPNGSACTGMARSVDNGVSFQTTTVNPAVECPIQLPLPTPANWCFPDQEHIAADRVNAGNAGGDQVYSVWRNFDASDQDAALVCTQDSGVTWTAPLDLGMNSFFPRITVGQDGFVYVAAYGVSYRIWKFNSCANGLGLMAGFPRNVAPRNAYMCPFAGHDRCDQNPSSQTVAVDDTDANHIYYAYANDAGTTDSYSTIIVRDSLDGGTTWPAGRFVLVNTATNARRILPWLCATGGEALLTWYESTGPVPSDTVAHVGGRAGLDNVGNLVAKETFTISEVPDNWCNTGWPCGTRVGQAASETCPIQPQNAGVCSAPAGARCDFSSCGGQGVIIPIGLPLCNCNVGATCNFSPRGGCPKYGDYNGNACAAGKLFAAWPSFNSPAGVPAPTSEIGVLFAVVNIAAPVITIPSSSIEFANVCLGETAIKTLNVCNTGKVDLQVREITSNDPAFSVSPPSSEFPVAISPDFCFPFEVIFTPAGTVPSVGVLSIPSNDPTRGIVEIDVSGSASEPNIVTVMDLDFGRVCLTDSKTQSLVIMNDDSHCPLTITDITIADPSEFSLATVMVFPVSLQPGESLVVDVEFIPITVTGARGTTLIISSDDPDEPNKQLSLSGFAPDAVPDAFMVNSGDFGEVCAGDLRDLELIVVNNGECPLFLDQVSINLGANAQAGDFVQPNGGLSGSVLSSGGSLGVPIRFAPTAFDNDPPLVREAVVRVESRTQFAVATLTDITVDITGSVPPPDIQWSIPDSGDFGNVCKDDVKDLVLTLFNQGKCDLNIAGIDFLGDPGEFEQPNGPIVPLILSPDADFAYPIRFSPDACFDNAMTRTITISSDDPDQAEVQVSVSGTSPCPNLIIDPAAPFPATVVDTTGTLGCFADETVILRNNGLCPLTIDSVAATGVDYNVVGPTVFPIILPPGEETLTTTVRFTPQSDDNPLAPTQVDGMLNIVSDDPDSPHASVLCGESAAQSGVRILVTDITTGTPWIVTTVNKLKIQSKGVYTPSSINLNFENHPVKSTSICGSVVNYHVNQESLPSTGTTKKYSSYFTKATERRLKKWEQFTLGQCEFRDFQLQLKDGNGNDCLLGDRGEPCSNDGECCSGNCKRPFPFVGDTECM